MLIIGLILVIYVESLRLVREMQNICLY